MKEFSFVISILFGSFVVSGQESQSFCENYKNNTIISPDSSKYPVYKTVENDSVVICRFYQKNGPMIKFETYRDLALTTRHGISAWYDQNGRLDSVKHYVNGQKTKFWKYGLAENGEPDLFIEYELTTSVVKNLSIAGTAVGITSIVVSDTNTKSINVPNKHPSEVTRDAVPSEFKENGAKGWLQYLSNQFATLRKSGCISTSIEKPWAEIRFDVSSTGKIENIFPSQSIGWPLDLAIIEVFRESPEWAPAKINGVKMAESRKQTINFSLMPQ